MKDLLAGPYGFLLGFLAALVSTLIVLGAFVLALTEGGTRVALLPTSASTSTSTPTETFTFTPPPTPLPGTPTFTPSPSPTATPVPSPTATSLQLSNNCTAAPATWVRISIPVRESLDSLAARYGLEASELAVANCFPADFTGTLPADSQIYVPSPTPTVTPQPTATPQPSLTPSATTRACGPPAGWTTYRVQPGDNLFQLHLKFRVSVADLQFANCLGSSTTIRTGQTLYVPNVPTSTPVSTATPTRTPTSQPTHTSTSLPPTTAPPAPTDTFTPTPTLTFTPTVTNTAVPTDTPTATATPIPPSPTPSFTSPPPTATDTPEPVVTLIGTPPAPTP